MSSPRVILLVLLVFFSAVGCAARLPAPGDSNVPAVVQERTELPVRWSADPALRHETAQLIAELLKQPLTRDAAVHLALLGNPDLQAAFEEVGIAQADYVEAGMLSNPTLGLSARFTHSSPTGTNAEWSVAQNFLEILMRPSRRRIAAGRLAAVEQLVAHEVLTLAAEVTEAYYTVQASEHIAGLTDTHASAARAAAVFAQRLHDAGNISDLELAHRQATAEEATVAAAHYRTVLDAARETLLLLLGDPAGPEALHIVPGLPQLPDMDSVPAALEEEAAATRFDVVALEREVEMWTEALAATRAIRWFPLADVSVSGEREPDGEWITGPSLELAIPLFDRKQAEIARIEAELRRSTHRLAARRAAVRSEVRRAHTTVAAAYEAADRYARTVLPLRRRIVTLTLQEYNFMLVGTFALLSARQEELDAQIAYVEAVREYWHARAALALAAGTYAAEPDARRITLTNASRAPSMPHHGVPAAPATAPASAPASQPQHDHHHHGES